MVQARSATGEEEKFVEKIWWGRGCLKKRNEGFSSQFGDELQSIQKPTLPRHLPRWTPSPPRSLFELSDEVLGKINRASSFFFFLIFELKSTETIDFSPSGPFASWASKFNFSDAQGAVMAIVTP